VKRKALVESPEVKEEAGEPPVDLISGLESMHKVKENW